ncbi:unnamed protein product [Dracunculus medinensis]|uniref:Uncharacterized protein n=1 Tax=Dracunculus medinensis TaxID=318479 RepID=A0A0N4U0V7_DRAME|nr:unnamed protein product [Dracunculus medinensis]
MINFFFSYRYLDVEHIHEGDSGGEGIEAQGSKHGREGAGGENRGGSAGNWGKQQGLNVGGCCGGKGGSEGKQQGLSNGCCNCSGGSTGNGGKEGNVGNEGKQQGLASGKGGKGGNVGKEGKQQGLASGKGGKGGNVGNEGKQQGLAGGEHEHGGCACAAVLKKHSYSHKALMLTIRFTVCRILTNNELRSRKTITMAACQPGSSAFANELELLKSTRIDFYIIKRLHFSAS